VVSGQTPGPPQGKLAYSEDFSDGEKSGLEDNVNATDFQRGFHAPGVYHIRLVNNNDTRWVVLPNQTYGPATFQLELWDNSDDLAAGRMQQGLILRVQDESHFYAVLIDPRKGEYAVRKLDGPNAWTDLIAAKVSPLVKRRDAHNQLRVDAVGDTVTIYLNGERLDSFTDESYARGGVGLIAKNVDAITPHLHFDNLMIFTNEGGAQGAPPAASTNVMPSAGQQAGSVPLVLAGIVLVCIGLGLLVLRRRSSA
jgi:LPXTG-motif cell wall-anchored protein